MFESRIIAADATSPGLGDPLAPAQAMLELLHDFAVAGNEDIAAQYEISVVGGASLAARYAGANSITRRRFDALLREAEAIRTIGLRLIVGRDARADPATIAAARFLGKSIATAIRRLENLVPPQPI